jgi:hypothetical protein
VDICTERRGIPIAILVRKANTGTSVPWILNPHSVKAVGVRRIQRLRSVRTRAGPLNRLRGTLGEVKDRGAA